MGKWREFFKALATNRDVMDDESIQAELASFLAENNDSVKRVSDLENRLKVSIPEKKKPEQVKVNRVNTAEKKSTKGKEMIERDDR